MDPSFFAPELFQPDNDAPIAQDALAAIAQSAATALEETVDNGVDIDMTDSTQVKQEHVDNNYPPLDDESPPINSHSPESFSKPASSKPRPKNPAKSKQESTSGLKSSVHSSKNEGQHTDRRYLCYLCNKLFTRRRSVRDHISKIHNTKTWEPVRSLEIVVDPDTGEPSEPLEDIIARGPPSPPPKPSKPERPENTAKHDHDTQDHENRGHQDADDDEPPAAQAHHQSVQDPPPALTKSPPPTTAISTLKKEPSVTGSRASSTEPFASPAPLAGKKRPAPIEPSKPPSAAFKKKGVAKPKPSPASNKRPKLNDSEPSPSYVKSIPRSPSVTPSVQVKSLPNSKLRNQNSVASPRSSGTPVSSRAASVASQSRSRSSSVAETSGSSNDDGEIFCICRKGDNHTWMIACDGGCEEWFHGNCVDIRERDGELIDKYICPTCMKPGLHTTWKRMCRRKDCRKPARVMQDPPSKYCSDACGRMFFVELVQRGDSAAQTSRDGQHVIESNKSKKMRRKPVKMEARHTIPKPIIPLVNGDLADVLNDDSRLATPAYSEDDKTDYETDSSLDDDELPNRAGALRAAEVKALIEKCKTIDEWRNLGKRPDTPPRDADMVDAKPIPLEYDELELVKMTSIKEQVQKLNTRNDMLSARETFLDLIKVRSANITDEVKKANPKGKDFCGFDPRLAWSDEEFNRWYNDRGGKAVLDAGSKARIGPPDENDFSLGKLSNGVNGVHPAPNIAAEDEEDEDKKSLKKGGVCIVKNCQRHKTWAKAQLAEIRFEQDLVRRSLSRLEMQENELKQRAMVRAWERRG
jgi:COMPASS component SPP1